VVRIDILLEDIVDLAGFGYIPSSIVKLFCLACTAVDVCLGLRVLLK
jgi:hypothetical protein